MNTYLLCLSLVLLPTVPCMAADAQPPHASRPGVMVTREVKQFGDLERDLIAAINAKDADGIGQLLADDFALHVGNNPADPTNRAEMIAQAMAGNALPTHFEHISAHDFGNVAVVSFSWNLDGATGDASTQKVFVVDTWKRIDEHWKLAARYASPIAKTELQVPGYVPHAIAPNKKI